MLELSPAQVYDTTVVSTVFFKASPCGKVRGLGLPVDQFAHWRGGEEVLSSLGQKLGVAPGGDDGRWPDHPRIRRVPRPVRFSPRAMARRNEGLQESVGRNRSTKVAELLKAQGGTGSRSGLCLTEPSNGREKRVRVHKTWRDEKARSPNGAVAARVKRQTVAEYETHPAGEHPQKPTAIRCRCMRLPAVMRPLRKVPGGDVARRTSSSW